MIISIEGCIGAGKTTLIANVLKCLKHVDHISEDVFSYTHFVSKLGKTYNPLIEMYSNPKQNTTAAQMHLMKSCAKNQSNSFSRNKRAQGSKHHHIIMDRCFDSCPAFIELAFQTGRLTPFARDYLTAEHSELSAQYQVLKPDIKVYLETDPRVCHRNIKARQREGEGDIPLDFLEKLFDILAEEARSDEKQENNFILRVNSVDSEDIVCSKLLQMFAYIGIEFDQKDSESACSCLRFNNGNKERGER